jgi:hypothetical protein
MAAPKEAPVGERGPKMNKSLFGYDPNAVERMLQERDTMLKVAERRVQAAETRAADLESRLASLEHPAPEPVSGTPAPAAMAASTRPSELVPEELAKVVNAAEASASQIIQAWTATRDQIVEADRLWRDVQDEVVRFAAWRDDVEPLMSQVQGCIDDARRRIEEVPARVQTALAPAVDAMVSVSEGMTKFAAVSTMPLLPSPTRKDTVPQHDRAPEPETEVESMDIAAYPPYEIGPPPGERSSSLWGDRQPEEPSEPQPHDPWGEEPAPETGQLDRLTEAAVLRGPDDNGHAED